MTEQYNVVAISGSLRRDSHNTAALRVARDNAPAQTVFSFAELSDIPLYNQDARDAQVPEAVASLTDQIRAADALFFAVPEYNHSVSGVLKNAIDWVSREKPQPFAGKPAAMLSASMSVLGGARAQDDLRKIMTPLDARFVNAPEIAIASAHERFDTNGQLTDAKSLELIGQLSAALADWTAQLRASR